MAEEELRVLNRTLYRRLLHTFEHVRVCHPGEAQQSRRGLDLASGKYRNVIEYAGEEYAICCPVCNDTRFRCHINHRYGTDDAYSRPQDRLVYCFNAGCQLNSRTAAAFAQISELVLSRNVRQLRQAIIAKGEIVDMEKIRSSWPGKVTRVDKLAQSHAAVQYLISRDFDPEMIGRFYNVHWCYESDRALCHERLIIPIYHNKKMVGWQARYPGELDWKNVYFPKYYTAPGTPRRNVLYNIANAKQYRVGVIVEGVTDVWAIGPMAVATLGATMTLPQQELFRSVFHDYSGVLFYDPDTKDKTASSKIVAGLSGRLNGGFCNMLPPEGTDPGSLARSFLRRYIAEHAALQGVEVNWAKR